MPAIIHVVFVQSALEQIENTQSFFTDNVKQYAFLNAQLTEQTLGLLELR